MSRRTGAAAVGVALLSVLIGPPALGVEDQDTEPGVVAPDGLFFSTEEEEHTYTANLEATERPGLVTLDAMPAEGYSSTVNRESMCQKKRRVYEEPGKCARKRISTVSSSSRVTNDSALAERHGDLVSADGVTLQEGIHGETIWTRTWTEEARGLYYFNWHEKHSGRFYFDGEDRVWVTGSASFSDRYQGYHHCNLGSAFGYSLDTVECSENRIHITSSYWGIQNWDIYKVSAAFKGSPFSDTKDMHVNVYPSGNMYFY
jgi:hypothetical protein